MFISVTTVLIVKKVRGMKSPDSGILLTLWRNPFLIDHVFRGCGRTHHA